MTARFDLETLSAVLGAPLHPKPFLAPGRVSTDTRTLAAGDIFLAIAGERFDGHTYVAQAMADGAAGAIVQADRLAAHPEWDGLPNLFLVADPVQAYLDLGSAHRRRVGVRIIGLTGSSGKTTTKEMLAAALSPLGVTQKTEKNFNNEIGVAQTLLALEPGTRWGIVEMGMRGLGEIRQLTRAAQPDVALLTNVGPAHLERLGSMDAIAQAKAELVEGLTPASGIAIFPDDDPRVVTAIGRNWSGQSLPFRLAAAQNRQVHPDGTQTFEVDGQLIRLSVLGEHMVRNALAVLRVGEALGLSVDDLRPGLAAFQPTEGRGNQLAVPGRDQLWVINEAYNANPDSMRASIAAFLERPAPGLQHVLVLAGMNELGPDGPALHRALGQWLGKQTGIDRLYTLGEAAKAIAEGAQEQAAYPIAALETLDDLAAALRADCPAHALILLKGSRTQRLEELLPRLAVADPVGTSG